jgi:hypothetical protein
MNFNNYTPTNNLISFKTLEDYNIINTYHSHQLYFTPHCFQLIDFKIEDIISLTFNKNNLIKVVYGNYQAYDEPEFVFFNLKPFWNIIDNSKIIILDTIRIQYNDINILFHID